MDATDLTGRVIGAAIEVHQELGPGLLESICAKCLFHELTERGVDCFVEVPLRVNYEGCPIDCGYRIDLMVEQELILELKSVDALQAVHHAQRLTCMKRANTPTSLLSNCNALLLKDGIKRFRL
ncbi:GxxExxY protein [Thioalkalivibrio sp. ALMg11]|uniref:GxxExxY protein n=1 Tax=Thioalkalivibrio sp. ALMg11 TaxID=1158165 RepID=UPI00036F452D|nr:GxxExxY protein [Thioalkalivibrio sp. ALMg11]